LPHYVPLEPRYPQVPSEVFRLRPERRAVRLDSSRGVPPLHPSPYTLHSTPYTLHPSPYTLHQVLRLWPERRAVRLDSSRGVSPRPLRNWYFIAEQSAPAPHLAHAEGCAALRIVLVTVPLTHSLTLRERERELSSNVTLERCRLKCFDFGLSVAQSGTIQAVGYHPAICGHSRQLLAI